MVSRLDSSARSRLLRAAVDVASEAGQEQLFRRKDSCEQTNEDLAKLLDLVIEAGRGKS
jgi:hypothetical protein